MVKRLFFLAAFLFTVISLSAQYYDEGRDPYSVKWWQRDNERYKIIFPEGFEKQSEVVFETIDTVYNSLHYGLTRRAKKLPVVLHGYNLQSNGVVSWAPKHAELVLTPPVNSFAVPWLKQLAIHEYRHVVQISNLNRNVVKYFGYIIGEQSVGAAGLLVPIWFLEGDATFAETAFASYGRGLQAEFTLEYRAYLDGSDTRIFTVDKWFCGSYKDYIPNHYNLGYQITNFTYRMYGPDFWENIIEYSTRKPYLIFPRNFAYKKYYGTSSKKLFRDTFDELKGIWDSLPQVDNSADVAESPSRSYTLYSYPYFVNDSVVFAVKYDLINTSRFVLLNTETGEEKTLAYTGDISSRPVYNDGQVIWTEYRAGTFWEQKNYSVLRSAEVDIAAGRLKNKKSYRNLGNLFFPVFSDVGYSAVEYNKGRYSLMIYDEDFDLLRSVPFPENISVHGLALDKNTSSLSFIGLGEQGMFISGIDTGSGEISVIKPSSYVTVSNLSAANGKLFFNSIESGKDEVHYIDLSDSEEYRITESTYGSIMPSVDNNGKRTVQVTYRKNGYFVSMQNIDSEVKTVVNYRNIPQNILNAPMAQFDVVNADSVEIYDTETRKEKNKRYRKGLHLFNVHSWAPLSFDPFRLSDESEFEPDFGVTVISQNVLSTVTGFLSYGYADGENYLRGKLHFDLFAPKIEVGVEYGGRKNGYIAGSPDGYLTFQPNYKAKDYFTLNTRVYLPFNLSGGYWLKTLTPSVSLSHYNTLVYDYKTEGFRNGYQKVDFSLYYSANARMAYRDIYPKFGYFSRLSYGGAPFSGRFGNIYSFYGGGYVSGILANHSLRLIGLYQYQKEDIYNFVSNILFPHGVRYNFTPKEMFSASADYKFPVAYPDGGIPGVLYIKRIYAGLYGGYSTFKTLSVVNNTKRREVYSYGLEVGVNANPFRMSNADIEFKGAVFFPSDSKKPDLRFTMSVNL